MAVRNLKSKLRKEIQLILKNIDQNIIMEETENVINQVFLDKKFNIFIRL